MKLTNREKILLPSVLIMILIALFINFVYFPLNKEIGSLKLQEDDLEAQLLEAKGMQAQVDMLKEQIPKQTKELEENNEDILKIWDQADLLVFLEKTITPLCNKMSIGFFDPVTTSTIQSGDISLNIKTNYTNLQKIWSNFEKAKYFNAITAFGAETVADTEDNLTKELEVSMTIRFYNQNTAQEYPEKYDFMKGSFGKPAPFEE